MTQDRDIFFHDHPDPMWIHDAVFDRAHFIRDEVGKALRMVGSFHDVTVEHEAEARRRQSQKLEAMGQLTGGVAHDFNNLLTVILGNAEQLTRSVTDPEQRQMAEMTVAAAERAATLTSRLLAFARKQPLEPRLVNVNELVRSVDGMLRHTLTADIQIEFIRADDLWQIEIDANQLEVALLNLVINARDAMPTGGKLIIETANMDIDDGCAGMWGEVAAGKYVRLVVRDTGTGMPPEVIERAFEPFFTTKKEGLGSGLGLSMVYGFVKQSGGHIRIHSDPGKGTAFHLYFPRSIAKAQAGDVPVMPETMVGGSEHILVVEDDIHVRRFLVRQLRLLGYHIIEAADGDEAYEILQSLPQIDLLFTDVVMPGDMNGRQLADAARVLMPDLKVLFTSGYTEDAIVHNGRLDAGVDLLSKPYRRQEMAAKVRKVLDK